MAYSPQSYWESVGNRLRARDTDQDLAGDASPFYSEKRRLFSSTLLGPVLSPGTTVLEVGCGPGGNLGTMRLGGMRAFGTDIAWSMLQAAAGRLGGTGLVQAEGARLPFRAESVDAIVTATVLQHNPARGASAILAEVGRIAAREIHLFEDTALVPLHDRKSHWLRRPDWYVERLLLLGFELVHKERLDLMVSELSAVALRAVTSGGSEEGSAISSRRSHWEARVLEAARRVDGLVSAPVGLTRMSFVRSAA